MKVLILGGSGFIGSALVPALLAAEHDVTLANRGRSPILGTRQIVVDRNDIDAMSELEARRDLTFDLIIDTSGYTGPQVALALQTFGKRTAAWIHIGSAASYRETSGRLPTETDPIGGAAIWGSYGVEKSDADQILIERAVAPTAILRPPYLYGPGNDNDRETFVFARALSGRPVVVPGTGTARLQFLHVSDLAQIILKFALTGWAGVDIYNVASPETIATQGWVELLAELAGGRVRTFLGSSHAPDKMPRSYFPFRDYDCALDTTKIQESRFAPAFRTLRDGFAETFASYDRATLASASPTTESEKEILSKIGSGEGLDTRQ